MCPLCAAPARCPAGHHLPNSLHCLRRVSHPLATLSLHCLKMARRQSFDLDLLVILCSIFEFWMNLHGQGATICFVCRVARVSHPSLRSHLLSPRLVSGRKLKGTQLDWSGSSFSSQPAPLRSSPAELLAAEARICFNLFLVCLGPVTK